jgi:hypothetical protein
MGVEFPSRTAEQRANVGNLISFLRGSPEAMLELNVSPRALVADLSQFEHSDRPADESSDEEMEDSLLELLRRGASMEQDSFLRELRQQRSGQDLATV